MTPPTDDPMAVFEKLLDDASTWEAESCRHMLSASTALAAIRPEVARLTAQLAECYRLTGADPDGNEDWRLAAEAVREVKRLRGDHDDYEQGIDAGRADVARLTRERAELIEALTKVRDWAKCWMGNADLYGVSVVCDIHDCADKALLARLTDPETPERTR